MRHLLDRPIDLFTIAEKTTEDGPIRCLSAGLREGFGAVGDILDEIRENQLTEEEVSEVRLLLRAIRQLNPGAK